MLNHPVVALFNRRLLLETRSPMAHVFRTALMAALFLVLVFVKENVGRFAAPGLLVFRGIIIVNATVLVLMGVAVFGSCITEEKEGKTLGLLRMSGLSASSILLGKATGAMMVIGLLLVVQIPFAWLCVTLGGITVQQVLGSYAVLLAMLALVANLGLLMSVVCRSSRTAMIATGVLIEIFWIGPIFLWDMRIGGDFIAAWRVLSPFFMIERSFGGRGALPELSSLIGHVGLGSVFFFLAWRRFVQRPWDMPSHGSLVRDLVRKLTGRQQTLTRAWRFPVAWQVFQFSAGGRFIGRIRGYALLLTFLGICGHAYVFGGTHSYRYSPRHYGEWFLIISLWGLTLESLFRLPRLFGDERKDGTWGCLVATTMSFGSIVRQKVGGLFAGLAPWLLFLVIGLTVTGELEGLITHGWHDDDVWWGMMTVSCGSLLIVYFSLFSLRAPVIVAAISLLAGQFLFFYLVDEIINLRSEETWMAWLTGVCNVALLLCIRKRLLNMAAQ